MTFPACRISFAWGLIATPDTLDVMNLFKYTLLRLGLVVVLFYLFMLIDAGIFIAGPAAILCAFALAYIFFPQTSRGRQRGYA